jgi:hypothetical protein
MLAHIFVALAHLPHLIHGLAGVVVRFDSVIPPTGG